MLAGFLEHYHEFEGRQASPAVFGRRVKAPQAQGPSPLAQTREHLRRDGSGFRPERVFRGPQLLADEPAHQITQRN